MSNLYLPATYKKNESLTEIYTRMNFAGFQRSAKFDDNQSLFFARELTKVQTEVLDIQYDDLIARQLFAFDTSGGKGLESIIRRMKDRLGSGAYVGGGSTDIPSSDVYLSENPEPVRPWATHVGWSIFDMNKAGRVGLPLQADKYSAAQYVGEKEVERISATGDTVKGLRGLFYDPSILTAYTLAADGTGSKRAFSTKDGDKIVRDVQAMEAAQTAASRGKEMFTPDTWVGTPNAHLAIQQKQMSSYPMSAKKYLLENSNIKNFVSWPALYDILGGKDAMFIYKKSPMVAKFHLPAPLMPMPVEYADLFYKVYFTQEIGGLETPYPYTICYALED